MVGGIWAAVWVFILVSYIDETIYIHHFNHIPMKCAIKEWPPRHCSFIGNMEMHQYLFRNKLQSCKLQQKPPFAPVWLGPPSTCVALSFDLSGLATTSSHQRTAFTNCSPPLCPIVKLRSGYQIEKSAKDNLKLRRWRRKTMKEKRTAICPPHAIWSTIARVGKAPSV